MNTRVVVLCLGNPIMTDEGVGTRVYENLVAGPPLPSQVEIHDAGTAGHALYLLFRNATHLLVIDAADHGGRPGDLIEIDIGEQGVDPAVAAAVHDVAVVEILANAQWMENRPCTRFLGIQILEKNCFGTEAGDYVPASANRAAARVREIAAAWVKPEPLRA